MSVFDKGLIVVLACTGLTAILAVPLILRKVPRNMIYGFRTRATLSTDFLWYEANAHFGRALLVADFFSAVAVLILYTAGLSPGHFINASVAVLVAPLLLAVFATYRHIRSLPADDRGHRGGR